MASWEREAQECYERSRADYLEKTRKYSREYRKKAGLTPRRTLDRKEYERAYRLKNRELLKARWIAYVEANPEKMRESNRLAAQKYYQAHKESSLEKGRRYKARKANVAINDLTHKQWTALKLLYTHHCAYCGASPKHLTMDHIHPLSRGGNHTLANILPACFPCNARKGNRVPLHFYRFIHAKVLITHILNSPFISKNLPT